MSDSLLIKNILLGANASRSAHELTPLLKAAGINVSEASEQQLLAGASAYFVARKTILNPSLLKPVFANPISTGKETTVSAHKLMPILKKFESKSFDAYDMEIVLVEFLQKVFLQQQKIPAIAFPLIFNHIEGHKKHYALLLKCFPELVERLSVVSEKYAHLIPVDIKAEPDSKDLKARQLWFYQERIKDPNKALDWLRQVWSQEKANTKPGFISSLSQGYTETDENFLESLIANESSSVQIYMGKMLMRNHQSAFQNRMRERLALFITKSGTLLNRKYKFEVPKQLPPSFRGDGIELNTNPSESKLEYAIKTMIQLCHPAIWKELTGMDMYKYTELLNNSNNPKVYLLAFQNAVLDTKDLELLKTWCELAATKWHKNLNISSVTEAFRALPEEIFNRLMLTLINDYIHNRQLNNDANVILEVLSNVQVIWSPELSTAVLKCFEGNKLLNLHDYTRLTLIKKIAYCLHIQSIKAALNINGLIPAWQMHFDQSVYLLKYRERLHHLIYNN